MSSTLIAILTSSAVSAGLIQLCTWAVRFMGDRQTRNASVAQTLTASAGGFVELIEGDNVRLRAEVITLDKDKNWFRVRFEKLLDIVESLDPGNSIAAAYRTDHELRNQ